MSNSPKPSFRANDGQFMRSRQLGRLRCERLEVRLAPAFMSFRAGDGFTSSDDTFIAAGSPQTPEPSATQLSVAGAMTPSGSQQALLRFSNLFGAGSHQIPVNATIKTATITLWALSGNDTSVPIRFYRNMTTWNASTATWDYFTDGLQTDYVELDGSPAVIQAMTTHGYQISSQLIVNALTAWQTGAANGGWAILPATARDQWSFASGDDSDPNHRPMLTVEYTLPGEQNPSYAELAGQPPSPLKSAWFDWADDLRQRRLDRVPTERSTTFYFAQNGDDLLGSGTIDHPWKSLAKAQQILTAAPIDVRLRFRRGDVWRETTTITVASDGITIDDYGDSALAKPLFTRFQPVAPTSWNFVHNGVYATTGMTSVGWLREAADGFSQLYYRAASFTEVASHPYSWWFDADGSDPASAGQPTLYVNANGNPTAMPGGYEYCPGDGTGWLVFADNVRLQNLRLEGEGMATDGFGYGLVFGHKDQYWEEVGQGLEVYFTGYHSIGDICQYAGTNGVTTLVDCKAGYCTTRFGDITVFVSYGDWGGNEYYQYNCEAVSGALPSSDWGPTVGSRRGHALYTHVGQGGEMSLLLAWKTSVGNAGYPVAWINEMDGGAPANDINDARSYIVEDQTSSIRSWWQKDSVVSINNTVDQQISPPPWESSQTMMYYAQWPVGGWVINCTAKVDARNFGSFYEFLYSGQDTTKYINCHIDISNGVSPTFFRNPYLNSTSTAFGLNLTNCIISIQSTAETGLNIVDDAQHLVHNAYYLPQVSSDPALNFSGDAGAVTLTQRYPAGRAPSPASPLFDGGVADGLEYDQRRMPRGVRRTIGPLAGASLPAPSDISVGWGLVSKSLGDNTVIPSYNTDRIVLAFPADVDVQQSSLRLWSDTAGIPLGGMTYDPITHVATWALAAPLARGRYTLELDSQPIKSFRVLPGDIDGDGSVAVSDFILFRQAFGSSSAVGDFDGNGTTDAADFVHFREEFNTSL
jgi:hypothetical protein